MLFAPPMYMLWYYHRFEAAIVGYILAVSLYLVIQGFTHFRHPLHGALVVVILSLVYAFLFSALGRTSQRGTTVAQLAFESQPNCCTSTRCPLFEGVGGLGRQGCYSHDNKASDFYDELRERLSLLRRQG